jgi:hypothetical protein
MNFTLTNIFSIVAYDNATKVLYKQYKRTSSIISSNHLIVELTKRTNLGIYFSQDSCCRSSDKYLLAMALVYFKKSGLTRENYTRLLYTLYCIVIS